MQAFRPKPMAYNLAASRAIQFSDSEVEIGKLFTAETQSTERLRREKLFNLCARSASCGVSAVS